MYEVNVKKNMRMDIDDAQDLVAQILREDFDFICKEINEMKSKFDRFTSVETQDWNRSMEVRDAMRTLLSYYMTHRDYTEFMELQRVYGNIA